MYEVEVDDVGPSLRNASAKVNRAARSNGGGQGAQGGPGRSQPPAVRGPGRLGQEHRPVVGRQRRRLLRRAAVLGGAVRSRRARAERRGSPRWPGPDRGAGRRGQPCGAGPVGAGELAAVGGRRYQQRVMRDLDVVVHLLPGDARRHQADRRRVAVVELQVVERFYSPRSQFADARGQRRINSARFVLLSDPFLR